MTPALHSLELDRVFVVCLPLSFSLFLLDMPYQLPDLAIKAILRDWHLQTYRPPYTDVREWIRSIETHCSLYGIPDEQWLRCAESFINAELRIVLTVFEPLDWNRLKAILIPIDRKWDSIITELPLTWI